MVNENQLTDSLYVTETNSEYCLIKFTFEECDWFDMVKEKHLATSLYVTKYTVKVFWNSLHMIFFQRVDIVNGNQFTIWLYVTKKYELECYERVDTVKENKLTISLNVKRPIMKIFQ